MFTGIIEEMGHLRTKNLYGTHGTLEILADRILADCHIGDSIAVNGVCLTVTEFNDHAFHADVMAETLRCTNLGQLQMREPVNLERAMPADGRFGGHVVTGHIDGLGTIRRIHPEGNAIWYEIAADQKLLNHIVRKGSVAIDGISLTVAELGHSTFSVSVIPHTQDVTTLGYKKVGDTVNLETDILAKYIERLICAPPEPSSITLSLLQEQGF